MIDNYAVERWYITDSVDRANDGTWSIDIRKLIPVAVLNSDEKNDLTVLQTQAPHIFDDKDMIPLCPEAEIPLVLDEQLFKTYYCPLGDCMFDKERPTLSIRVSEKKKMTCLKRTDDGRMWFEGGLCAGSSGGAGKSSCNAHGISKRRQDSRRCSTGTETEDGESQVVN